MNVIQSPSFPSPISQRRSTEKHRESLDIPGFAEMAHETIFDGPISESVPSSISSFAHRRHSQAESEAESALHIRIFGATNTRDTEDDEDAKTSVSELSRMDEIEQHFDDDQSFLEQHGFSSRPLSLTAPLLKDFVPAGVRWAQVIYLEEEAMFIKLHGYRTTWFRKFIYILICIGTFGLGYLALRWIKKWEIRILGCPTALADCDWIAIQNKWDEVDIIPVQKRLFNQNISVLFGIRNPNISTEDIMEDSNLSFFRFIDYRYTRLYFNPQSHLFILNNSWKDSKWRSIKAMRSGIEHDMKDTRLSIFGENVVDIEEKSFSQLLIEESLHPFYMFQIFSIILWSLDEYYYYAACIFVISVGSVVSSVVDIRNTMIRLREISRFVCDVRVLRNGYWSTVSSCDLVPGDVYEISAPNLKIFPCDSLLLSGSCISNESMLTGESVPIAKTTATNKTVRKLNISTSTIPADVAKHFLFAGTKVIRVTRPIAKGDEEPATLAMVVRTGFNTTKGALVRSMLFPKPIGFKFYRDSFRYIGVLAIIAVLGFIVSTINFIDLGVHWRLIVFRALDLITIVVPPALPTTLTIGTKFAIFRLKQKKIFCTSPNRIIVAGKVDIVCFDKTGTLTEEGLDILGVHPIENTCFGEIYTTSQSLVPTLQNSELLENRKSLLHAMTTCHAIKIIGGELAGDSLDVKMFEFTGWDYDEEGNLDLQQEGEDPASSTPKENNTSSALSFPVVRPPMTCSSDDETTSSQSINPHELGIVRVFDFASDLRRMSVLVKHFNSTSMEAYVKGAPEIMRDICNPKSIPRDYEQLLSTYTKHGYRVIACANRVFPKMSWIRSQRIKRIDIEQDLAFLGFIVFENKLKSSSESVIKELQVASIRNVMCTGDNLLTAISVGRECGLISKSEQCFVPYFIDAHESDERKELVWESIDDPSLKLDGQSMCLLSASSSSNNFSETYESNQYSLAVTGEIFRWIIDFSTLQTLNRMLLRGQIYARMSPDEKNELVSKIQSLDYCVCFCGDGANDCGALKAADVGISLSEAEASVAAPFTSGVYEITCVPEIIRQGRAALVTSFSCFKYMALYSAIQFATVSFMYKSGSNLGDFQFLFIDLFLILPIAVSMANTDPQDKLCSRRPTASLVSKKILTPLLGQIFLATILQFIVYHLVKIMPWYVPPFVDPDKSSIENSENTSLFLLTCYQYVTVAIICSIGPPYRQPMYTNCETCLSPTTEI
ncbi:putative cation-transporting ATPase [Neolecta irregularis DAH-3]|uniref:Cation-transporting ATPase n=1 Tax=Neolecta irregularis (strain DAH-3) TaxID=1198029 RepID=A0A1U7LTX2_NEOID|nr:putative cation-transporting ATPase [Neolecta irregularis DAH-3]|eukprot:OLL26120.1 putative cation-transporting ATPase [Neolecta irregularis DAH-3]